MKVAVDRSLCQGHNRCHEIAPDIFDLDDLGFASTDEDRDVPDDAEDLVIRAARACPELAVRMSRTGRPDKTNALPGSANETEGASESDHE